MGPCLVYGIRIADKVSILWAHGLASRYRVCRASILAIVSYGFG